jgi:hypothetical protein
MMTRDERIKIATIAAAIVRDMHEVPAGHLYAALMPHGVDIEDFQTILAVLEHAKLIKQRSYLLKWIGPEQVKH